MDLYCDNCGSDNVWNYCGYCGAKKNYGRIFGLTIGPEDARRLEADPMYKNVMLSKRQNCWKSMLTSDKWPVSDNIKVA